MIQLPLRKEYEREVIQCPEGKCAPANSSQSSGFIEFGDKAAPHVFSGPMDGGLHLIIAQQEGAEHAVIVLPAYFFFESQKNSSLLLL